MPIFSQNRFWCWYRILNCNSQIICAVFYCMHEWSSTTCCCSCVCLCHSLLHFCACQSEEAIVQWVWVLALREMPIKQGLWERFQAEMPIENKVRGSDSKPKCLENKACRKAGSTVRILHGQRLHLLANKSFGPLWQGNKVPESNYSNHVRHAVGLSLICMLCRHRPGTSLAWRSVSTLRICSGY